LQNDFIPRKLEVAPSSPGALRGKTIMAKKPEAKPKEAPKPSAKSGDKAGAKKAGKK